MAPLDYKDVFLYLWYHKDKSRQLKFHWLEVGENTWLITARFRYRNLVRVFLYHCISDGNHLVFVFRKCWMSDKAMFVSGELFCVQCYRGNLDLSRSNSASCWQIIHLHIYAATNSVRLCGLWYKSIQLYNSFTAIHVILLELKNNKHNTYYRYHTVTYYTYLHIVYVVIFKLLTSYLKRDLAKTKQQQHYHFNMSC